MHLQKLTAILGAMDKPMIKKLSLYVMSPYFDTPVSAQHLFKYLEKVYPDFSPKRISPIVIAKQVSKLPQAAKQAKAGTELLKAVDDFISLEHWKSCKVGSQPHLIYGLKKLNLYDRAELENTKLMKNLSVDGEQDVDIFYLRHLLTESEFNGFETKLKRNPQNDITPVIKTLDEFHAIKKLRYICEAITRNNLLGTAALSAEMAPLLTTLEPFNNLSYPYVFVFLRVFTMMMASDFDSGFESYRTIHRMAEKFKGPNLPGYIAESMEFAINWCLRWNAKGNREAGAGYLWWIDLKIKYKLLLDDDQLLPITYRNIVSLSIQGHRPPKWAKGFIEQYAQYLPEEYREANYDFALALYLYASGDHESAMPCFQRAQAKSEPIFSAIIRRWQFMCLYEKDPENINALMTFLDTFDKYILRQRAALHQFRPIFSSFIHYANRLMRERDNTERSELLSSLKKQEYFPGKDWLTEKISG